MCHLDVKIPTITVTRPSQVMVKILYGIAILCYSWKGSGAQGGKNKSSEYTSFYEKLALRKRIK
jgi:hypothetical protein